MRQNLQVDLCRSRTANGGWEWYFTILGAPVYPTASRVGVFTGPDVQASDAFRKVLSAWVHEDVASSIHRALTEDPS